MGEKWTTRRKLLASGSAVIATTIGGVGFTGWTGRKWGANSTEYSPITEGGTVALEPVAEGFDQPLALENPAEDHLYIADKFGQVYLYAEGTLQDEPILDIADQLVMDHGEQGLLGLEFHPDFENNRKFYVRYSSPAREGTPNGYSHTFVLSEFQTTDDYQDVVSSSERPILEIPEPGQMHNAGAIEFGPDGYLYVALGDGGGDGHDGSGPLNQGPDSHAGDWYWINVGGNGQDTAENLLSSILRIDVDNQDGDKPYSVPDSNPLTEQNGLNEHYAWGFRNPYSMTFDGEDLYVADAGTKIAEEVNLIEKGGNYGWNVKEGSSCHSNVPPLRALSALDLDVRTLPICPNAAPNGDELKDPVISYSHELGVAIIGGEMYRNTMVAELEGKYVFGDLSGRLFAATPSPGDGYWTLEELFVTTPNQPEGSKFIGGGLLSVEKGTNGELFVLTAGQEGSVQRIRPST